MEKKIYSVLLFTIAVSDSLAMSHLALEQHNLEIHENAQHWGSKPLLRRIYRSFHENIRAELSNLPGINCELGSGIGNIKEVIPDCLRTDLFSNPWLDQQENAYSLSFADSSVSNLILFDVFHHLRYPGNAFREFTRVLQPGGRVILFEPCVSLLGRVVYGLLHHEPLGLKNEITWNAPQEWQPDLVDYYAAQGNAFRIFCKDELVEQLNGWKVLKAKRLSSISYVASGGYSKPQLYPDAFYPCMRSLDKLADLLPGLFATRLLVSLEKIG
jgi:SAM-dependent methyltransferase